MPHLDFREALSTPEDKVFSPPATAIAIPATAAVTPLGKNFFAALGLSRSTWANIVFVAIASVGGLVCAFYFFNGAEVLRAAASWPGEYLYPRPLVSDHVVAATEQPNRVDQYGATENETSASKTDEAKNPAQQNAAPTNFVTSAAPTNPATPPVGTAPPPIVSQPPPVVVPPVVPPIVPPIVPSPPTSLPLTNRVDTLASNADTFVQTLSQNPIGTASSTVTTAPARVAKSVKKVTTVAKRKISKVPQKAISAAGSTSRNLQQMTQTQTAPMTQMTMGPATPVNQMMSSGGMGGISGLGGGIGGAASAGAGATGGSGAGAVGGTVVGLGGGLSGGGLGGTISGVGGTVGGVVGGLGGHH